MVLLYAQYLGGTVDIYLGGSLTHILIKREVPLYWKVLEFRSGFLYFGQV